MTHLFQISIFQVYAGVVGELNDVGQDVGQFIPDSGAMLADGFGLSFLSLFACIVDFFGGAPGAGQSRSQLSNFFGQE